MKFTYEYVYVYPTRNSSVKTKSIKTVSIYNGLYYIGPTGGFWVQPYRPRKAHVWMRLAKITQETHYIMLFILTTYNLFTK